MVVRLLADARRRNEVRITIAAPLTELLPIEREIETRFGINRKRRLRPIDLRYS